MDELVAVAVFVLVDVSTAVFVAVLTGVSVAVAVSVTVLAGVLVAVLSGVSVLWLMMYCRFLVCPSSPTGTSIVDTDRMSYVLRQSVIKVKVYWVLSGFGRCHQITPPTLPV